MSALLLLRAVAAACLLPVTDALGVQGAADDLVADTRQVTDTAAADEHDRVLLEVVAHTGDVGGHLDLAGEPDPGGLAERRVRLLGRGRIDARANPAALGAALQRRSLVLGYLVLPALTDQLLDRGQRVSVFLCHAPSGAMPAAVQLRPAAPGDAAGAAPCGATWCLSHARGAAYDVLGLLVSLPGRPPRSGVSRCSRHTRARTSP